MTGLDQEVRRRRKQARHSKRRGRLKHDDGTDTVQPGIAGGSLRNWIGFEPVFERFEAKDRSTPSEIIFC